MLTPEELLQLTEALAPAVWAYGQRTLTQPGGLLTIPAAADALTIYRNGSLQLDFVGLGDLTGVQQIWFTIKSNLDTPDNEAILQIGMIEGLIHLNSQPADVPAGGSLTITDQINGNVRITLTAQYAAMLPLFDPELYSPSYDLKIINASNAIYPVIVGKVNILTSATAGNDVLS